MAWLAHLVLLIVHTVYGLKNLIFSFIPHRTPRPLLARRRKIPGHVGLILVPDPENHDTREEEKALEKCVERAVKWCKAVGIQRLSVYERDGVLSHKSIYASSTRSDNLLLFSDMRARDRLTPPSSDTDSPRVSPSKLEEPATTFRSCINTIQIPYIPREDSEVTEQKPHRRKRASHIFDSKPHQQNLTLHILSRESSKPNLAAIARSLARKHHKSDEKFTLSVEELNTILEVESDFPPLDQIIVYRLYPSTTPLELYGFPPWHMRLSELFYVHRRGGVLRQLLRCFSPSRRRLATTALPISEADFRRALDEYSDAEFRLGK